MDSFIVIPWKIAQKPTEESVSQILINEGLKPFKWSNNASDHYAVHSHTYWEIFYVIKGSLILYPNINGIPIEVKSGDRVEVPPKVLHEAKIGPRGVVCIEANRRE